MKEISKVRRPLPLWISMGIKRKATFLGVLMNYPQVLFVKKDLCTGDIGIRNGRLDEGNNDVEFFLEIADLSDKTYYKSAVIKGEFTVKVGETVISPEDPSTPLHVATIVKI